MTLTGEAPCMKMGGASGRSVTEALSRRYMDGIVAAGLNKLNYSYCPGLPGAFKRPSCFPQ
jgi:hypothetical protein